MDKIEPLQTLLKIYKDKHNCLMKYLPEKSTKLAEKYNFIFEISRKS